MSAIPATVARFVELVKDVSAAAGTSPSKAVRETLAAKT
jgi:hypothetical protein